MLEKLRFGKLVWVWSISILCVLLLSSVQVAAEDVSDFEGLTTLDFTMAEISDGEKTTYRFRYKDIDTPEEAFRVDMTEPDGSRLIIILDKDGDKVVVKDVDQTSWQSFPGTTLTSLWRKWVKPYVTLPHRRSTTWAEIEGQEFLIEGDEKAVEIYDIKVNKPIEEPVFKPE